MKNLFCKVLLLALIVLALSSCGPAISPIPTDTPTEPVIENVPVATPSAISTLIPVESPTVEATITPTPVPVVMHPGWTSFKTTHPVRAMAFDLEGNLWAGGPGGLIRVSPAGIINQYTTKDGLANDEVTSITVTPDNAIWIGTWGGGVSRFDGQNWQTFTTADGLWDNYVHAVAFIPPPIYGSLTLFFGTRKGLSIHSENGWANYINAKYGLPEDEVLSIATGSYGELWVGTKKGVMYLGGDQPIYTTANGLAGDEVNSMAWAPDCSLWFGTDGGVSRFDGEHWTSYTTADGLVADRVLTVASALDGSLWFGTAEGVSRLDGKNWTTYTTADGLAEDQVSAIFVAPDNALWFGTSGNLTRYLPPVELASQPDDRPGGTVANASALRVVYVKDGNIWRWGDGSKKQLTTDGRVNSLKLSEDGSRIAFTRLRDGLVNELWTVLSDGNGERLLVSADDLAALADIPHDKWSKVVVIFHYDWIPGSHTIAYDTRREINGPGTLWSDDLRLVDAETGEQTTRLPYRQGGFFFYSPDGSKVAIVTPERISIMSADGKYWQENVLEYSNVITYSEYRYYPQPVWAPDSQYLLVAVPPEDGRETPPKLTPIWHIPVPDFPVANGEAASYRASLLAKVPAVHFMGSPVAFSPDLTRILYIQRVGDPQLNQYALHLANADGTEDKVIQTGSRMELLGWSPDGAHFAFSFGDPSTGYIGDSAGSIFPLGFEPVDMTWIDGESFLHIVDLGCAVELRMTNLNGESQAIDRMWKLPVSYDIVR